MFKTKIKILLIAILGLIVAGCSNKIMKDDSGNELPKQFTNTYLFLDYSKQFSDSIGKLTNRLLDANVIDEDKKDEIGKVWKEHKKVSNDLQKELSVWYTHIKNNEMYDKSIIHELLKNIILRTETLNLIIGDVVDEESAILLNSITKQMTEIYNITKE